MLAPLIALALAAAPALPPDVDPFLRQLAETRRFAAGRPTQVTLTPDGKAALFLRSGPRSRVQALWETSLETGETRALVTPEALSGGAALPTRGEAARLERQRITARGITHYELSADGKRVAFAVGGRLWLLERGGGAPRPLPAENVIDPRFSPDGRRIAFVKGRDLHVLDLASGRVGRLTRSPGEAVSFGVAEFVAQEEMDRDEGYWWSPDAKRIAYAEVDEAAVERRLLCDPARPEEPCDTFRYPRAGTPNAAVRLLVAPVSGGRAVPVRWDAQAFPYLATVKWDRGGPLTILVQNRTQTEERLLAVDAATGATRLLLEERDAAWVNLWQDFPRWLEDGSGFLWVTERSGWPEVELRAPSGERRATVVPGRFNLVELAGVEASGAIWFTGAPDPTQTILYRVAPGGAPVAIPAGGNGPAMRKAIAARTGDAVAVSWSTLTELSRWAVFSARGEKRADLPSVAEEPGFAPTTTLRKVGPGDGLWTALILPRDARPGARLPVVVSVYGGPSGPRAVHRPHLSEQWLADQGFAVVLVDGRGTSRRGRAFETAVKGDFATIPLEDQIAGLRALARERPELDVSRVGIHGWSFGGYAAALAALARPDVFRAALAGAPVSEWRDYDTHYTERYLGLPGPDAAAYDRSSLLPLAARAPAPGTPAARLLVVHGTADDNVWFSHALKLVDALFRAGRPF
ncbi:MAG TPA: DPP IV N-terminal domain-containing protein, partial [Anaeromyxobacteraceae bacterium]|nr:DPP IV N-terminal domain-containing protein [Anaeromyxobacteraceae bacterium]